MSKTIVIIATLDTKGDDAKYIKELIEGKGHRTILIDSGVLGEPVFQGDFTREKVAQVGGKSLTDLVDAAHRGSSRSSAIEVMIRGVVKIVKDLYFTEKLDGIVSLGGGTGAAIGTLAMKALPIGVPKLMISTYILPELIGAKDITVMQTPADIVGRNPVMRRTLANAAGAIVGMVEVKVPSSKVKPLIAMTSLGVTTLGVMKIIPLLEERGYEAIVFHNKSETLDELTEEGKIYGVIDLTTNELVRTFIHSQTGFESIHPLREDRLEPAGRRGLPQVIAPGGLDMHILRGTPETVPSQFKDRKSSQHTSFTLLVRTSREEMAKLGKVIAERANRAIGPVAIVIPLRGFSSVDKEGKALYDPEADRAFIEAVRNNVQEQVEIVGVDAHINDDAFAEKIVDVFDELSSLRRITCVPG